MSVECLFSYEKPVWYDTIPVKYITEISVEYKGEDKMTDRVNEAKSDYESIIEQMFIEALTKIAKDEVVREEYTDIEFDGEDVFVNTYGTIKCERTDALIAFRKVVMRSLEVWAVNARLVSEKNDIEQLNIVYIDEQINIIVG